LRGSKPGRRCADTYNRTGIGHIVPRGFPRRAVLMPAFVTGMADRSDNVIGRQSGCASTLPMLRHAREHEQDNKQRIYRAAHHVVELEPMKLA
jgi:hypothetical protein